MPNAAQHVEYGALAGAVAYIGMSLYYERPFDIGELLLSVGASTLAACVPDALEPACHPGHRKFIHSLSAAALAGKVTYEHCKPENKKLEELHRILLASGFAGYISHLAADACTPRGLPLA
jgi:membrane-bound metal-dependent hydrolase YbcI (DUF457 family)